MRTILAAFLFLIFTAVTAAMTVDDIRVVEKNGQKISTLYVLNNITTAKGAEFQRDVMNKDIHKLYKTGRYSDVEAKYNLTKDGVVITLEVELRAIVKNIRVVGNKEVKTKKILAKLSQKLNEPLHESNLSADKAAVAELYADKGQFDAVVDISTEVNKELNTAVVTITISETKAHQIDAISFTGNTVLTDDELIENIQSTPSFWRYLFNTGYFDKTQFDRDLIAIKRAYLAKGYLDFKVLSIRKTYDEDDEYVSIELDIYEGKPYTVKSFKMSGATVFPQQDLEKLIDTRPGMTYNKDVEEAEIRRISRRYNNKGYLDFRCYPKLITNANTNEVEIIYPIYEGVSSTIRDILIFGNDSTREYVIRRELAIHPGDISNKFLIEASENRLKNTGYFEKEELTILAVDTGNPHEKDLQVRVREQSTGRLSLSFGFSDSDGVVGGIGASQNNFDIAGDWDNGFKGGGQRLSTNLSLGSDNNEVSINFVEPWFMDQRKRLSTSIYGRTRYYDDYRQKNMGVSVSLAQVLERNKAWSYTYGLKIENVEVDDFEDDLSPELLAEETSGDIVVAFTSSLKKDTTDNALRPSKGERITFSGEFQPEFLGSEENTYKLNIRYNRYFQVFEESTFKIGGEIAVVDSLSGDLVPIYDRYLAGGQRSVRGYDIGEVSNVDSFGDSIGGQSLMLATAELNFPLYKSLIGAVFVDAGDVNKDAFDWDPLKLSLTAGFGVRFNIPGLGPLVLDYGIPFANDQENGGSGRFHFTFGYTF